MGKSQIEEEVMKRIMDKLDKLDDKMDRKFDQVESRLDSMDKTLVKQEANLAEHMRRTELAEEGISGLHTDLEPVKKHVAMVHGALKFIGMIATVVGIVAGIIKIISGL